jgi:capsular exopolysaccharide synthesis family protein
MEELEFKASDKSINPQKLITVLLARWYFVVLAIIASTIIAFLYLRYTPNRYKAELTLKFQDEQEGQLGDLFKYGRLSGRIENQMRTESVVLKSRNITSKVLDYLGVNYIATIKGNFITSRIYPNSYFDVKMIQLDSLDYGRSFRIEFNTNNTYKLFSSGDEVLNNHQLGDTILIGNTLLSIVPVYPNKINDIKSATINISISSPTQLANSLRAPLQIDIEKNTTTMNLSYESDIAAFASDYLNALANVYINEIVQKKKIAGEQSIKFIDNQLIELSKRVDMAQNKLTDFKSGNKSLSPTDIGKAEFDRLIALETEKGLMEYRKSQLKLMQKRANNEGNKVLEMVVFDPEDATSIIPLIELLNESILDYQSKISRYSAESPVVKENQSRIDELKRSLYKTLAVIQASIDNKIVFVNKQINEANEALESLPAKEQALFNLERNFKVNEKIFGYLQEKRLENLISLAAIIPNIMVVEEALVDNSPIFPKPNNVYGMALAIGLGLGVGLIFLFRLFNDKVTDKETIEAGTDIPVLGIINQLDDAATDAYGAYVLKNPKSMFAESIRGIRTNANFILKGEIHKIISLTSTVSGEGKTFCSINIAASAAQLGYKVLIVGCDLRRPKLHEAFDTMTNKIGLTSYLVNRNTIDEIIQPTTLANLEAVAAGPTPPNPAELLQTKEFDIFLETMKERYDFVFLDTAPVGLVADSLTLLAKADLNLYVFRANYSRKNFCSIPGTISAANDIKNLYIILNAYDPSNVAYSSVYTNQYSSGYGGYYYYGNYYRGGYGTYGSRYYQNYYTGYYTDVQDSKSVWSTLKKKWFKRKK